MASVQNGSSADPFEVDTIQAIGLARDAYARVIEQKCSGSKAVTVVAEAFGIHRKLAWQLIKVAYTEDPFVAARHMPVGKGQEVWLAAIESAGIGGELIDRVREADDRFRALMSQHASSKSEFEMLIGSASSGTDQQTEERWRQQAFEGNCFTWGAHCKVLMAICVLMPSEDREHYFHAAQIRGLMGFRQTRANVRWVINQSVALDDSTQHEAAMERVAIDPDAAAAHNGVPVLPPFCSDPMPSLERSLTHDGMMQDEFLASGVGLLGERTVVTGEMLRNIAPVHATSNDRTAHFGSAVRTPAEVLHFDLFVRAGLFGDVTRELRVFSDIASQVSFRESDALPVSNTVRVLGRGLSMAHTPDLSGYLDMTAWVFNRLGLNASDYELYRVRMAYPPVPTTVMLRHDLLDPWA